MVSPRPKEMETWSINLRWPLSQSAPDLSIVHPGHARAIWGILMTQTVGPLQKTMKIMKLYISAVKEDMKARHRCKTRMETTPLKHIILREHIWSLTTRDAFSQPGLPNFQNSTIHKSCTPGPHRNVSHAGRPLLVRPHARCVRRRESLRLGTPTMAGFFGNGNKKAKNKPSFFVETYSNNGILIYSWHHFAIWW